ARRPPRPQVKVSVGDRRPGGVGADAMLDFNVSLTLEGEEISAAEWKRLLAGSDKLVLLKGKWVEIDRERLQEVLQHWKTVEQRAREGVSFLEGMRLLSGLPGGGVESGDPAAVAQWTQVKAGAWLDEVLADLQRPEGSREADPGDTLK